MSLQLHSDADFNAPTWTISRLLTGWLASIHKAAVSPPVRRATDGLDYAMAPEAGSAIMRMETAEMYMAMAHDIAVPTHLLRV